MLHSGNIASYLPTVTDYYWANIPISDSPLTNTTPTFGRVKISGEQPIVFTKYGSGTYNIGTIECTSTAIYFERPRTEDKSSANILPLIISQRGGGISAKFYDNNLYVAGNIGVGTDSPAHKLDVRGRIFSLTSDVDGIIIKRQAAGSGAFIRYLSDNQDAKGWRVGMLGTQNDFTFEYSTDTFGSVSQKLCILKGGGLVSPGHIIIKGSTSNVMTYDGNVHGALCFENSDSSQNIRFIFTDYDSYRSPAGIKLVGNQGGEWFETDGVIYASGGYPVITSVADGNGYPALLTPSGSSNWIRVSNSSSYGLLPNQSGSAGSGHGYLGTSSWYFKYAYIDQIYGYLNGNISGNAAYATNAGNADTVDGYHASSLWRSDGGVWNPTANILLNATANGQEWSFDITRNGKTGCYWHVWDSALGTLLKVNADDGKVSAPQGFVGNLAGTAASAKTHEGYSRTITVNGDPNTYYPVVINTSYSKNLPNIVTIWKNLGSTTASYSGNHSNGTASCLYRYDVRISVWDGNGGYCKCLNAWYGYAPLVAHTEFTYSSVGHLCVWLRGGGTTYEISSTWDAGVTVYYSRTDLYGGSYPCVVEPRTSIGNGGKYSTTYLGYGDIAGNVTGSSTRASYLSGHHTSPNDSHPGHGARVFYSWNIGSVGNDTSGYSTGITIGSNPNDTGYGFQIVQNLWDDRTYTRRYNGGWQNWKTLAWTSDIPTVTDYYWANIKVSASSSTSTQPTFNTCYTSNWFRSTGNTGWYNETHTGGIYMSDSTWVRTYNSKSFYCSADIQAGGRIYTGYDSGAANSVSCSNWFRSNGNTGWYNPTNNCHVYPNATTTYGGLMLRGEKGGYTGFILGSSTNYMNLMDNGTDKGLYQEGKLWILYYNRSSNYVGIRTASLSYPLTINGDSYTNGWSRAANGFYVHDTGVHFTHQGTVGEIDMTSNNEFLWGSSSTDLYFNYRAVSRGTTVTTYRWHAGSSTSYANHVLGKVKAQSTASSWLDGQRYERGGFNLMDATDTGSYWPWMRQTNTGSSKWFSMGVLGNCLYFIGSATSRTENSYDYGFRMDFSNGYLYGNFSGYLSGTAYSAEAIKDSNNGTRITACYSTGGFSSNPSWLAAWNGYHLTYVSPGVLSVNYATSAGTSSYISYTNRAGKGNGTAQFTQYSGSTDNPTNDWYSHIIMNHANSGGYYTEIATCFHSDSVYFRRQANGSTNSWKQFAWTSDIPSVGNGTVTITQNGTTKGSFTMNQSGNTTIALTDNNTNTTYSAGTGLSLSSTTFSLASRSATTSTLYIVGCTSSTSALYTGTQSTSGIRILSGNAVYAYGGFYESSDERLKNILNPIKVDLDELSKLRKIYYLWKENSDESIQLGVIAQDVQKLYPELVGEDEFGLLSVAYDKLSVIALEAIDTLYQEHKQLKKRVDRLEKLLKDKGISKESFLF